MVVTYRLNNKLKVVNEKELQTQQIRQELNNATEKNFFKDKNALISFYGAHYYASDDMIELLEQVKNK